MRQEKLRPLLIVVSPIIILSLMSYLYSVLHRYDWGQPFTKLMCFAVIFTLIVILRNAKPSVLIHKWQKWVELAVICVVLGNVFVQYGRSYGESIFDPPAVDIGTTTVHSASMLVKDFENPYSSQVINPTIELKPEYRGFHYGPAMLLGYLPAAFFPAHGFKIASLFFILISAILLCLLVDDREKPIFDRITSMAFVLCLFFLSERFWYEVLRQGANDIFPVALILAALYMLKNERFFLTGLLAGLSLSAKFSPAVFFLIPSIRKDLKAQLIAGIGAGLVPLVMFSLWDFLGLFNNAFLLRLILRYDSTSLYSILPVELHFWLPVSLLIAVLWTIRHGFKNKTEYRSVLISFTLLLIIAEITFKEIHANHLIWFYPLFALILEKHRHHILLRS